MVEGKKIGTQIVLHPRDDANNAEKNETRNLGLQSIVNREDTVTSQLIYDASTQRDVAASINDTIQKMNSIIINLTWIGNAIYGVIQDAYMADTNKTQKFVDIQNQALGQI